jgi:hypothetical protein
MEKGIAAAASGEPPIKRLKIRNGHRTRYGKTRDLALFYSIMSRAWVYSYLCQI